MRTLVGIDILGRQWGEPAACSQGAQLLFFWIFVVPIKFSMCSHQVPLVFLNLFQIALHFVPYALPNICPLGTYRLGMMLELETYLFECSEKQRTNFKHLPRKSLGPTCFHRNPNFNWKLYHPPKYSPNIPKSSVFLHSFFYTPFGEFLF